MAISLRSSYSLAIVLKDVLRYFALLIVGKDSQKVQSNYAILLLRVKRARMYQN